MSVLFTSSTKESQYLEVAVEKIHITQALLQYNQSRENFSKCLDTKWSAAANKGLEVQGGRRGNSCVFLEKHLRAKLVLRQLL